MKVVRGFLEKYFPLFHIRNIGIYYLLAIFLNGWFFLPNWVFYYSQYIPNSQIGVIEGISILIGILFEVPTGAISDLLGKKLTLIIGTFSILVGALTQVLGNTFWAFLIGNTFVFIGFAFNSGSLEAFAYDSLLEKNQEARYSVVIGRYTFIAILATVVSTFLGGWLYRLQPEFTFFAWAVFLSFAIIALFFTREPKIDSIHFNLKNYVLQLASGIRTLFNTRLLPFILPIILISCIIRLYQGLVRQSIGHDLGFTGETFGYLLGTIMIPVALVSYQFSRLKAFVGNKRLLLLICVMYASAFILPLLYKNMWVGVIMFFLMMSAEKIAEPLISVLINERIDSKHRATTLSTLSLISQIPYIILTLFFAYLTTVENIHMLYILFVSLSVMTLLYSLIKVSSKNAILSRETR